MQALFLKLCPELTNSPKRTIIYTNSSPKDSPISGILSLIILAASALWCAWNVFLQFLWLLSWQGLGSVVIYYILTRWLSLSLPLSISFMSHFCPQMESFLLNDVSSMIHNKASERIISPMTVQLCHLILSMEKKGTENEVFASLEKMAEELVQACEEFVQVAER